MNYYLEMKDEKKIVSNFFLLKNDILLVFLKIVCNFVAVSNQKTIFYL